MPPVARLRPRRVPCSSSGRELRSSRDRRGDEPPAVDGWGTGPRQAESGEDQNMSTTDSPTVFDALLAEIAHNNPRGRIVVAVDGAQDASTARFADALADAARAQGTTTFRESAPAPQLYTSRD